MLSVVPTKENMNRFGYVPLRTVGSFVLRPYQRLCSPTATCHQSKHPKPLTTASTNINDDQPRKHIVLLSGGVESSTLLRKAALEAQSSQTDEQIIALFCQYGQKTATQEHAASKSQCEQCGVTNFVHLDLTTVGEAMRQRQQKRLHVPLLHRNLVLMSLATSLAAQEDASRISIALCADDQNWYPSASNAFVDNMRRTIADLQPGLCVETPLAHMTKADVVRVGLELGVRFDTTWSCMLGGKHDLHCGRCSQCRARKDAFRRCGVSEDGFYER